MAIPIETPLPSIISRLKENQAKVLPLAFGTSLNQSEFRRIQTRLSLDFFKWDCQVGNISTLFRQPLLLETKIWDHLKQMAEALAAELIVAEQELFGRPDLWSLLAMPASLRSVLREAARYGPTPGVVRTLRFDFHYSTDGWRISEVNSDVPGGYTEASAFTELVAECIANTMPAGNPAMQWANAMMSAIGRRGHVALLSAVGFLEDQQLTAFLASQLEQRGVETILLHHPSQLNWKSGHAFGTLRGKQVELDAIVRFYQGEWLTRLTNRDGWKWLFARGKTPVTNAGTSLLTESKRFPLSWDFLSSRLNTWRRLLPESRDPREARWPENDDWVLKLAYSNTGDEVHIRELMNLEAWESLCRTVRKHPEHWIAQRRFKPVPIASDLGLVYPCIGVYVIDGRAAGAYTRVATRGLIDYAAMDAALLVREAGHDE